MSIDTKSFQINITTGSIIRVILFVILGFLLYTVRNLLFLLLVSIVIATFVDAVAFKMKRFKMPRLLNVIIVFAFMMLALLGIMYAVIPTLFTELFNAVNNLSTYLSEDQINSILGSKGNGITAFFDNFLGSSDVYSLSSQTEGFISNLPQTFFGLIQVIFGGLANIFLIVVLSFYLAINENGIENFLELVTPVKHEEYIKNLWKRTSRKIASWIRGQMFSAFIIGVVTFIGLKIFGVPYALLLSLLTFVAGLIPYGTVFATIPAILAGLSHSGLNLGLIVLLFYFLLQQFENYILLPLINKKTTGISPIMVILSLLIGAKLAGFWGLLLAMPVSVFLLEIMNDFEDNKRHKRKILEEN